jgi:hypothetical protein
MRKAKRRTRKRMPLTVRRKRTRRRLVSCKLTPRPPVYWPLSTAEPPTKKRKAEDDAVEPAKKTKTDDDDAEEDEDDAAEAPEDDADEQEDEDDEPAVKTKVVSGSESKAAAVEADDEEHEKEAWASAWAWALVATKSTTQNNPLQQHMHFRDLLLPCLIEV